MDILVLKKKGLTQRQIARKLGISRNTVKKYIENQGYLVGVCGFSADYMLYVMLVSVIQ